jgi:hypothetical protein
MDGATKKAVVLLTSMLPRREMIKVALIFFNTGVVCVCVCVSV